MRRHGRTRSNANRRRGASKQVPQRIMGLETWRHIWNICRGFFTVGRGRTERLGNSLANSITQDGNSVVTILVVQLLGGEERNGESVVLQHPAVENRNCTLRLSVIGPWKAPVGSKAQGGRNRSSATKSKHVACAEGAAAFWWRGTRLRVSPGCSKEKQE
jgi:hypothetical protein